MTVEDLVALEGWKETSAQNLISAIEASKSRSLQRVVIGLGIDHVGGTVAGLLARHFGSMDALGDATADDIEAIDGIGPEIARSVEEWFADPQNRDLIDRLGGAGVSLVDESTEPTDDRLDGLTVVITGTLDGYSRDAAKAAVEDRGGKVTGSVSRNTSALVAGMVNNLNEKAIIYRGRRNRRGQVCNEDQTH